MDRINQLMPFLVDYWNDQVKEIRISLAKAYPMSSGGTSQAIGRFNLQPVSLSSQGININIYMPPYYLFMDEGVSGAMRNTNRSRFRYKDKKPPISAMRKFMINRGIVGRNYRKLRSMPNSKAKSNAIDAELNKIAYAISYKIWRDGIRGTQFYSKVINDASLKKFEDEVLERYGMLVIEILEDATKKD